VNFWQRVCKEDVDLYCNCEFKEFYPKPNVRPPPQKLHPKNQCSCKCDKCENFKEKQ